MEREPKPSITVNATCASPVHEDALVIATATNPKFTFYGGAFYLTHGQLFDAKIAQHLTESPACSQQDMRITGVASEQSFMVHRFLL